MLTETPLTAAEPTGKRARLKYQQVVDFVLKQIADGRLKPGDALPAERVLAKTLGRSLHTIRHALDELRQNQVVRRVHGKGTFVNEEPPAEQRRRLDVVALVLPEVSGSLYPSLIRGFIEAAAASYHQVLVCDTQMNTRVQGDMILQLLNKNVAGVAIVPMIDPMPGYQLDMLRSHGIPVVFCHRRPAGLAAPLISWPWQKVGQQAGELLVSLGHQRIAFVAAGRYVVTDAYWDGLRQVLSRQGLEVSSQGVLYTSRAISPQAEAEAQCHLARLLEAPDRPTAVFCSDASEAEWVFLEALRLGLRVPEDLSIVGFGCIWREGVLRQRLTTITIDEVELGRRAAALITQMQAEPRLRHSEETVLVPLHVSPGRTLGSVPTALPTREPQEPVSG